MSRRLCGLFRLAPKKQGRRDINFVQLQTVFFCLISTPRFQLKTAYAAEVDASGIA